MPDCSSIAIVPAELARQLAELKVDYPPDERWECDFDADHPGDEHWTIAFYGGAGAKTGEDVWLRWSTGGEAGLVEHPGCESDAPSGTEEWTPTCYWVKDHPGLHSSGDERW